MGMDVYGTAPTTEAGGYFRNNVWWWRPLAEYVTSEFPDETAGCMAEHPEARRLAETAGQLSRLQPEDQQARR